MPRRRCPVPGSTGCAADGTRRKSQLLGACLIAAFAAHDSFLTDRPNREQPGLRSLGLSVHTARRIRSILTSPPHAAALALSLFTGLWAPAVAAISVAGLSVDADTVAVPVPRRPGIWHPPPPDVLVAVPVPARPLLRAARFFKLLHGATAGTHSLTLIGTNTRDKVHIRTLTRTALACGLTLPAQQPWSPGSRVPRSGTPWPARR